jgi:hypothetical protein
VIRIRSALIVSALTIFAALGCGDDEELDDAPNGGTGGTSASGGTTTGGVGGSSGGSGGSGATGGVVTGGGTGGDGGTAGQAGAAGAAGADAGDGCLPSGTTYQFDWCPALIQPNQSLATSVQITVFYFGAIHQDCRISPIVDTHPEIALFGNDVNTFAQQLWGCQGSGVTTFDLVQTGFPDSSFPNFTAADAALLIKIYVARSKEILGLGPANVKLLTDTLNCLAKDVITNPSTTEYSMSVCPPDAGTDAADDASLDGGADQ